ncbi:MAG: ABC transporter permease [Endomicrobium sp.]|jgi:NitT/TauT family transport system permease protein|nr:ABC transporter permease [Endomicrobium sp.]
MNDEKTYALKSKRIKWFENPLISEDKVYWKPKRAIWFWLAVLSFAAAFGVNVFIAPLQETQILPYRIFLASAVFLLLSLHAAALRNPFLRAKLYHYCQFIFALGIFLSVWDLLTDKTSVLPVPYFPSAASVLQVMVLDHALILKSALYSLRLFFAGFLTGIVLGVSSGILIGWARQWDYWLSPIIKVSGIIPPVVWIPLALSILPGSFSTGVFLIFAASWFPVASMTANGISSTPKKYFEAAQTFGAQKKYLLFKVAVPHAMPNIFMGILTAAAFSFTTLIVSEMIGAKAGLGFYINWAKAWGAYSKMYAAIVIIALEFSVILLIIGIFRRRVLRWQKGIVK